MTRTPLAVQRAGHDDPFAFAGGWPGATLTAAPASARLPALAPAPFDAGGAALPCRYQTPTSSHSRRPRQRVAVIRVPIGSY